MHKDYCKGCRNTYYAILSALTANKIVSSISISSPLVCLIILIIHNNLVFSSLIMQQFEGAIYSIFTATIIAYIVALISIWKTMPNLISISKMIYSALGYWSLVSSLVLFVSAWKYIPSSYLHFISISILTPIVFWLFTVDLIYIWKKNTLDTIRKQEEQLNTVTVI
jgi:hypothetical protein